MQLQVNNRASSPVQWALFILSFDGSYHAKKGDFRSCVMYGTSCSLFWIANTWYTIFVECFVGEILRRFGFSFSNKCHRRAREYIYIACMHVVAVILFPNLGDGVLYSAYFSSVTWIIGCSFYIWKTPNNSILRHLLVLASNGLAIWVFSSKYALIVVCAVIMYKTCSRPTMYTLFPCMMYFSLTIWIMLCAGAAGILVGLCSPTFLALSVLKTVHMKDQFTDASATVCWRICAFYILTLL